MITGDLGAGKTAMLTRYGCLSSHKKKLVSNYHYNFIDYMKLDIVDLYFNHPELRNIFIAGDELYTFMDCRTSMSKRNRLESYFVTQTRKKNVDLYFTTQFSELVDFRLIRFVNIWIKMQNFWIWTTDPETGKRRKDKHPYLFKATFTDYRNPSNINKVTKKFDARRWFKEYNTNEVIYPPDDIYETQKAFRKTSKNKAK